MALLLITSANGEERKTQIDSDVIVIGRAPGLALTLEGTNVSRRHAQIIRTGSGFAVEDLGSSNGTYVNDKRIEARVGFTSADVLRIGSYRLRLETERSVPADLTIQRETIALADNNELYRENAAQKLQAVLELAHELANTLDVETLLNRFLDQVFKLFPNTDRALILFLEKDLPTVRLVRDRRRVPGGERLFSRSILKQVAEKGIAILAEDTQVLDANVSLNTMGVRSLLCVPLRTHGAIVFGAVQLDRFQTGHSFNAEDLHLLTAVTLQISLVIEKARLHQQLLAQERILRELALAREIQLAFLPQAVPILPRCSLDLHAELHPAEEVAGDFYDFIVMDDSRVVLVVADVSGKGIPAALFMSVVRALLRQIAQLNTGPAEILMRLNDALARDNPKFMFVTVLIGIYNAESGQCVFARGGHPAPLLRKSSGTIAEIESHSGYLMGIAETCPPIQECSIMLENGDALVFYTDGVTEAADKRTGEMFGCNRLMKTLDHLALAGPLRDWAKFLYSEVKAFCGAAGPEDDITLLVLRHG